MLFLSFFFLISCLWAFHAFIQTIRILPRFQSANHATAVKFQICCPRCCRQLSSQCEVMATLLHPITSTSLRPVSRLSSSEATIHHFRIISILFIPSPPPQMCRLHRGAEGGMSQRSLIAKDSYLLIFFITHMTLKLYVSLFSE